MHHKGSQHMLLLSAAMLLALLLGCSVATAHCDQHSHHRHLPQQHQHQQHHDLSRKLQQQQPSSSLTASSSDSVSVGVISNSASSSSSDISGPILAIRRRCGTQSPSAELLASVFARLAEERRKKSGGAAAGAAEGSIVVPVAFTVVEPEQQEAVGVTNRYYGATTASQLTTLLAALNAAFSGQLQPPAASSGEAAGAAGVDTPFRFRLCSLQTVRNSSWYTSPPLNSTHLNLDGEARQEHRSGGRGTLNVFIKPLNVFPGMDLTDGWTYGQATLPHYLQFPPFPAYSAAADGVVIDGSSIPGATDAAGNSFPNGRASSLMLAHQVAHWLSGLHTYQSTDITSASPSSCSAPTPPPPWAPEAAGDFCADTPVHAAPATAADTSCSGADGGRDSCSNWPGRDPVFNILNNVDEGCMLGFTACQRNVFEDAWTAWRAAAATDDGSSATTASAAGAGSPTATDDTFRFQVAPAGGGAHSTVAPASFVLDVFQNDVSNIPGHTLTVDDLSWAIVSPPARGRLSVTEDATALVYTPEQAGSLTDSFSYRAFDCFGASAPATVTINVVDEGCPTDAASFPPCVDPRTGLLLAENTTCTQNTTSIFCIPSFSGTRWCRYRYRPAFVECRPTAAECDAPERCTGVGPNCPADVFDSSCMAATCANPALPECVDGAAGSVVKGEDPCTTNSTIYCSSVVKGDRTLSCSYPYKPATAVCRPSKDDCDMVDRCVPGQPTCPEDKKVPNCPLPACPTSGLPECVQPNPVVLVQSCVSGINQHCSPVPNTDPQLFCRYGYKSSLCRPAKDSCDLAESCTAGSALCPPDVLKPNCETGFKCPTVGLGNCVNSTSGLVVDSCTNSPTALCKIIASGGSRFTCRYAYLPPSTVCRAAKDECDLTETCQPGDAICPSDLSKPGCVLPANNTGLCPTEGLPDCVNATSGTFAAICFTTSSAFCLSVTSVTSAAGNFTCSYQYKPATTACRPPANQCDPPEFCNFAPNCPPDIVRPNCVSPGTSCPTTGLPPCVDPSNGVIVSAPGSCLTTKKVFCQSVTGLPGTTGTQFCRYSYRPSSSVCRPAAGPCDKPDTCHENGIISASCGPDRLLGNATVCRPAASACDAPEVCSGTSIECPLDVVVPPKKVMCRQAYDPCDLPEVCNGQDRSCPADRVRLNGRACSLEPYGVFLRTASLQQAKLVNATAQGPAAFVLADGTAISPPPAGLHRCGRCRRGKCDQTPEQQWWCW